MAVLLNLVEENINATIQFRSWESIPRWDYEDGESNILALQRIYQKLLVYIYIKRLYGGLKVKFLYAERNYLHKMY